MNDEAHIGFVDAHAEGDGRHDSLELPVGPLVVYLAPSGPLWKKVAQKPTGSHFTERTRT